MKSADPPEKEALEKERMEVLQQVEEWLEVPMLLGFAWLVLVVVEFTLGLNPFLEAVNTSIWVIFIVEFALRFILARARAITS